VGDHKVKGTMFVDLVKMIRANKRLNWSKYLSPADWEVINTRIVPSKWYSLELYEKFAMAVFQVLAKGNTDVVRQRGRVRGKELFEGVYQSIIISNDPMESLSRFVVSFGQFFNFSLNKFENAGNNHAKVSHESEHPSMPYSFQLMGHLEVLVEIAGGKNVKIEMVAKQWEGAPSTVFDITWD
jgi:hypothetical protein